jgi:hypothetical protein
LQLKSGMCVVRHMADLHSRVTAKALDRFIHICLSSKKARNSPVAVIRPILKS